MRKVTIGNMLEMFLLADMYKAPDLREATKYFQPLPLISHDLASTTYILFYIIEGLEYINLIMHFRSLIVANSRELLKKRQWKEKLKESGHLVFEILEAVIKQEEVN